MILPFFRYLSAQNLVTGSRIFHRHLITRVFRSPGFNGNPLSLPCKKIIFYGSRLEVSQPLRTAAVRLKFSCSFCAPIFSQNHLRSGGANCFQYVNEQMFLWCVAVSIRCALFPGHLCRKHTKNRGHFLNAPYFESFCGYFAASKSCLICSAVSPKLAAKLLTFSAFACFACCLAIRVFSVRNMS